MRYETDESRSTERLEPTAPGDRTRRPNDDPSRSANVPDRHHGVSTLGASRLQTVRRGSVQREWGVLVGEQQDVGLEAKPPAPHTEDEVA